mmetsp:Transcript_37298/g.93685  ORF Transcript_37298/g.93685 Transcript_37298/m.93685 type:complete len:400 (-) Transcript_37298:152-1351(-)|eukprot:CAMPEP_0177660884 /NCGR_PEP_ID=MMETSP0447-20121125/18322_1 /TAXON_ID=0 /ORGANISM="Stygamoeba regulata, Strain BSH-02190019" /LENGTH=399 /DNA_ID=CAMNT_0019166067 /DNA_START=536 /DNA_END=1735 /DNA_ORIENTATION=+
MIWAVAKDRGDHTQYIGKRYDGTTEYLTRPAGPVDWNTAVDFPILRSKALDDLGNKATKTQDQRRNNIVSKGYSGLVVEVEVTISVMTQEDTKLADMEREMRRWQSHARSTSEEVRKRRTSRPMGKGLKEAKRDNLVQTDKRTKGLKSAQRENQVGGHLLIELVEDDTGAIVDDIPFDAVQLNTLFISNVTSGTHGGLRKFRDDFNITQEDLEKDPRLPHYSPAQHATLGGYLAVLSRCWISFLDSATSHMLLEINPGFQMAFDDLLSEDNKRVLFDLGEITLSALRPRVDYVTKALEKDGVRSLEDAAVVKGIYGALITLAFSGVELCLLVKGEFPQVIFEGTSQANFKTLNQELIGKLKSLLQNGDACAALERFHPQFPVIARMFEVNEHLEKFLTL